MKLIQEGPRTAKIMFVGDAPNGHDLRAGRPFIGGQNVFDSMLSRTGISRSACFLTNVCHTQPPKGDLDAFVKTSNGQLHVAVGMMQLKKDIEQINPNVIVALGATPLKVLTGKVGISKWRGSILESTLVKGKKVIATHHPLFITKLWDYKAVAELDLMRVRHDSSFPELRHPVREYILDPDGPTRTVLANEMEKAEWLSIDIECVQNDQGKWKLSCVGFSDRPDRAMVIPAHSAGQLYDIRRLCASPAKKIFQNGTFDCTVLGEENIPVKNFVWDTMLAHHSLYLECASGSDEMSAHTGKKRQAAIAKGLGFLTSINTREPFYKDDGKIWKADNDIKMFYLYNGKDAAVTREIRDVQDIDLKGLGVWDTFQHEMSLVEPLMGMTNRGIRIDMNLRSELKVMYETQISRLQAFVDKLAGGPVNVKSTPQVKDLLYNKLGLPVQYNRKTKRETADKDAITLLSSKVNHPVLKGILEIRERRDMLEKYIAAPIDADGRIRCSFDITGTNSGRLSSRQSIHGSGTNLQNIPARKAVGERIKEMFIADEGKVLINRDYKQAEAFCVAYEAECMGLIELFMDPTRDIHRENAARIFNKALDAITFEERYLAKRVVHACNYGMEGKRLVQLINLDAEVTGVSVTLAQANDLILRYFMLYPEIKENFWSDVEKELRHTRTLTNAFGRKRVFFGRWDDELIRSAYSFRPQSSVGDLACKAVVRCYHEVELGRPELGAELLLTVHDSILMQCYKGKEFETAQAMERAMSIPMTIKGRTFTIPTDCEVGLNWAKHRKDNPNGLVDIKKLQVAA